MRFRSGNPRAAFRRLPPELRGPALSALVREADPAPDWVWAELVEFVSLPAPTFTKRQARIRALCGAIEIDLAELRTHAITLLAERWKCLSALEKDAAIAIAGVALGATAVQLASDLDPARGSESVRVLARALGEPCSTRVLALLCMGGDQAANEELVSVIDAAVGSDGRTGGAAADAARCSELLEGVAWAIGRAKADAELKVSRGLAWAAWALLETCRESNGARDVLVRAAGATDSSVGRAMGGVLRWDRDPLIRRAAWRWAPVESIGAAAIERLSRTSTVAEHEVVLRLGHLAARPIRRQRLAMIAIPTQGGTGAVRPGGVLPTADQIVQLTAEARRQVVRMASATGTDLAARAAQIEPLLTDDDEMVRLSVAAGSERAETRDLCFDQSSRVARVAVHRWSRCGVEPTRRRSPPLEIARVLASLSTSAHEAVRRAASEDLRATGAFDHRCPMSRLAARRAAREDPETFLTSVRAELVSSSRAIPALLIADSIGMIGGLEADLMRMAAEGMAEPAEPEHGRLLAVVAKCLRSCPGAAASSMLTELVGATDNRVRANALDSLVLGLGGQTDQALTIDRLLELKSDPAHRVRGAAARGLSTMARRSSAARTDAVGALRGMISDDREEHRAAGMWAAARSIGCIDDTEFRAWVAEQARDVVARGEPNSLRYLVGQSRAFLARMSASGVGANP